MPSTDDDSLIPLVVGITGHRTIAPGFESELEREVLGLLRSLRSLAAPSPLVVLTPLAKGADRIAARAALSLREEIGNGVRVLVPLPFPESEYERDFTASDDLAEFRSLRARCQGVYQLRPRVSSNPADPGDRPLDYLRLGLQIVRQSHVVIALWNGDPPDPGAIGGTGDIVRYCTGDFRPTPRELERIDLPDRPRRQWLVDAGTTPLLVVPTPRPDPEGRGNLASAENRARGNERVLREELRDRLEPLVLVNRGLVARRAESAPNSHGGIAERRFARLDRLASSTKAVYLAWTMTVSLLALSSVVAFQIVSSFDGLEAFLVPYLLLLAISTAAYGWGRHRGRHEELFVLGRTVAEHLRVQLAWHHGGLDESVFEQHIARRVGDLRPVRTLAKGATADLPLLPRDPSVPLDWVAGQYRYFDPDGPGMDTRQRRARLHRGVQAASFLACVGLAVALAAMTVRPPATTGPLLPVVEDPSSLTGGMTFLIGCCLAFTVFLETRQKVRLDGEDLQSGRRMRTLYGRAAALLAASDRDAERREILKAVGKEALDESADWFVRHRDRMERPGAG